MTDDTTALTLTAAEGRMLKCSNNILNFGEELVTAFTIPLEGFALNEALLDAFLGQYTFRSLFNQAKDGAWSPMPWVKRCNGGVLQIDDEFDVMDVELVCSGKRELLFEHDEDDAGKKRAAASITKVCLEPQAGGITLLSFHLTVRPDRKKQVPVLLECQKERITVTMGDTTVARKKGAQQSLDLAPAADDQSTRDSAVEAAVNGDRKPIDGTTAKSRASRKAADSPPAAH